MSVAMEDGQGFRLGESNGMESFWGKTIAIFTTVWRHAKEPHTWVCVRSFSFKISLSIFEEAAWES